MGRSIAASDAFAEHHAPAGTLSFREQFTSASTTSELADRWMTPFENAQPIRAPAAFKGQRNFAGLWWCTTNQRHVGFESWCERDNLMSFDFDPNITGISSQPFRITWSAPLPQHSHVPDFFIRHADGTAVVIDVRPNERVKPADEEIFQTTMRLCSTVGWEYQPIGSLPAIYVGNLRGLSGYRHHLADPISPEVEPQDPCRSMGTVHIQRNTAVAEGGAMTGRREPLRIGDDVEFRGTRHQLTAVESDVALLAAGSEPPVAIKLSSLFADKSFKALSASPIRRRITGTSPLFEALPHEVRQKGRWLDGHITEVLDGAACNAEATYRPRRIYNPQLTSLRQRDLAKIAQLDAQGVRFSLSKLERLRRAYERQGVIGLVDQNLIRRDPVAGKTDQRVVDATVKVLELNTHQSSGTTDPLMRQVRQEVEAQHGAGTVAMPSRATFHRLVSRLAEGRHATGSARTRCTLDQQPAAPFSAVYPVRPGELMQIDSTPQDIAVELDDGVIRTTTKAVDAALLLAGCMTLEPMRPCWSQAAFHGSVRPAAARASTSNQPTPTHLPIIRRIQLSRVVVVSRVLARLLD